MLWIDDDATLVQLAIALADHRKAVEAGPGQLPDAYVELADAAMAAMRQLLGDDVTVDHASAVVNGHLLTFDDAAKILRKSTRSVRRLVAGGRIRAVEVGDRGRRITRADLDAYINRTPNGQRPRT